MAIKINEVTYSHFGKVIKLTNGEIDVMVTADLGPRVIFYGFSGGTNMLAEMDAENVVNTEFGDWHPWGGHRLWAAPEAMPRSYWPDNDPVAVEPIAADTVRAAPSPETGTGLQKEIDVMLDETGTRVVITHRITNIGLWPVELSVWGLTIMNGGGVTIFPQEPFAAHGEVLLPARPMVLWNYTDFTDPRWTLGKKYVQLKTDDDLDFAQKVGAAVKAGWAAYLRKNQLFVKQFPYKEDANYPDYGCNFETFTKGSFMEVETLGAVEKLEPGKTATHIEQWHLFSSVDAGNDEDSLANAIEPLISSIK